MGLQLSILVGCVGALELLACLKHVIVCKLQLTDQPSNCCIDYFHRQKITKDLVILDECGIGDEPNVCSEIEAILRETRSEPDILCIGPPPVADSYVRIPTPIPFGIDDEVGGQKSSSNASSIVDSGNENPTRTTKSRENTPTKEYEGSSSDVSSIEDGRGRSGKSTPKKVFNRSKTPEDYLLYDENYDNDNEDNTDDKKKPPKSSKTSSSRRSFKTKARHSELGRSAESLSSIRRSKRHREPERCKSDIQLQVSRNASTNTSPMASEANLPLASSKRSVSVLIQTSFEDKLHYPENNDDFEKFEAGSKLNACPNCSCVKRVRRVTETESVDGKPLLLKISSFEEASEDDYDKLKRVIGKKAPKDWTDRLKSSLESESEYVDAEEVGLTFSESPIEFTIPDPGDGQAFWVNRRPRTKTTLSYPILLAT